MKLKIIFTLIIILLISQQRADATILRVGYTGPKIGGVDYGDLQSAVNSASTTVLDTIMLYPGYWTANVNRKLVFIGTGYIISGPYSNSGLQNITGGISADFFLNNGADSCIFEGIAGINLHPSNGNIVNNIIIRRCQGNINLGDQVCNNWKIFQSYLNSSTNYNINAYFTNLLVYNTYLEIFSFSGGGTSQTGQFFNCLFNSDLNNSSDGSFGNGNFILTNCIFLREHAGDANIVYQNCLANNNVGSIPSNNGNQNISIGAMDNDVFVGWGNIGSYSYDSRWALKSTSPAVGAGVGGVNLGIFGGNNPYKLSGIPRTPTFYKLTAPSNVTGTNPYTITLSVKSNN